jgi:predicted thioesterase
MPKLSFDENKNEISVGTQVCVGDCYPWGSGAEIVRASSIQEIKAEGYEIEAVSSDDEILYWIEYVNKNYSPEYV